VYGALDVTAMRECLAILHGEHDFTSFRAASCQAHTPIRTIQHLDIAQHGERIVFDCRANAFLHHMVRNIVGSLVPIGLGERDGDWLAELLAARDRRLAGMMAPAQGLCLTAVEYPDAFGLAQARRAFW
jgi:tRNA pseudouridine38-40 synthase